MHVYTHIYKHRHNYLIKCSAFCFILYLIYIWVTLRVQLVKNLTAMWETWFNPWVGKIPWRRERLPTPVFSPGELHGLYSMWSQRVGHDWATFTSLHISWNLINIMPCIMKIRSNENSILIDYLAFITQKWIN